MIEKLITLIPAAAHILLWDFCCISHPTHATSHNIHNINHNLIPVCMGELDSLFGKGRILTRSKIWQGIQGWVVVILPILFLIYMDLPNQNDCCGQSAIFSPEHRPGIYIVIFLCIIAYTVNILRVDILTPVAELVLNVMLILVLS